MSILITFDKISDTEWFVNGQYSSSAIEELPKEIVDNGIIVPKVPKPEPPPKHDSFLYYDAMTGELYYKYIPSQPTPEDEVQELKNRIVELEIALAAILGGAI